jgi:TPR repeat protein
MVRLAAMMARGEGGKTDPVAAEAWLKRAALVRHEETR